jgi:hypothetical protein
MATSSGNFVCDNSTLANFKSWAQSISNAISAFGWVQTTDTGQVNWASIASVPASTYVYEVWKANDAVAGTMPIFVKIEYGFSTSQINFRFTVGTSSSGAGVITGTTVTSGPWQVTNNLTNQGSTTFPCFFSGNAGEFRMWMWGVTSAVPALGTFFAIERSKDTTGAITNEYVTIMSANQGTASFTFQQTIKAASAGLRDTGIISPALTSGSSTGSSFGTVAAFPVFPVLGKCGNPMLGVMTAVLADAAVNSTVTVASMYGSTHTYVVFGGGATISNSLGARAGAPITIVGLMRFE